MTGEEDCDAPNESQISATYCIVSVQHRSVLSVSTAVERDQIVGEEKRDCIYTGKTVVLHNHFNSSVGVAVYMLFPLQMHFPLQVGYIPSHLFFKVAAIACFFLDQLA